MSTENQVDFLTGTTVDEAEIIAAKEILLEAGYKIIKIEVTTKFTTVREVKNYFYDRLYRKYPERMAHKVDSVERDMKLMNAFIESRMAEGNISKAIALQECVDIIDVIFDYEDEFWFKYPIVDTRVFGLGKVGWITQKAIEILNRERYKKEAKKSEKMLAEIEDSMEIDLVKKSDRLSKMLEGLEDKNG